MNERYYKPSGKIPVLGALLTLVIGLACAAVLGALYGGISFYNPFIYVNFLGAFGVGFLPAIVIGKIAYWQKIRSKPFLAVSGILAGLMALYFSWIGYIVVLFIKSGVLDFNFVNIVSLVTSPLAIGSIILSIAENGVWSMASYTPTGVPLYIIWTIEAGIIIVMNSISPLALNDEPFCEDCNAWTKTHDEAPMLQRRNRAELKENLEQKNYKILDMMLKEEANPANCFVSVFHICPHCEEANYLTISHVTLTEDAEGKTKTNTDNVIQNLSVPYSLVETFTGKAKALHDLRTGVTIDEMNLGTLQDNEEQDETDFPK